MPLTPRRDYRRRHVSLSARSRFRPINQLERCSPIYTNAFVRTVLPSRAINYHGSRYDDFAFYLLTFMRTVDLSRVVKEKVIRSDLPFYIFLEIYPFDTERRLFGI